MKRITMKDIAAEAGVSTTTVSKILNNVNMHISDATKERVWALVRKYNYTPNAVAKGLRSNNRNMIGVLTHDIADPFVAKLLTGIESICRANGISVLVSDISSGEMSEQECFSFLSSNMVNGIIVLTPISHKNVKLAQRQQTPIVLVSRDTFPEMTDVGTVDCSAIQAVHIATELLLRIGCTRLAYIGPSLEVRSSDRVEGYINTLRENGKPIDDRLIYTRDGFSSETGVKGIKSLFCEDGIGGIDGIVCANDLVAAGAILALSKKGLRVPDDVKVIGIDNIAMSQYFIPPLTTVDLHGFEVGVECAEMIIARIRDDVPLGEKLIDCELVMRESV